MTARDRLQLAYELAFLPARLNGMWRKWDENPDAADADEMTALEDAARRSFEFAWRRRIC